MRDFHGNEDSSRGILVTDAV